MKTSIMGVLLAAVLCGCSTVPQQAISIGVGVLTNAIASVTPPADPEPLPPGQAQTLWDSYYLPAWSGHNDQANLDRRAGINACRAAGKTCISFNFKNDSGAFKIAVYHWPSDVDGHFMDASENWTEQARMGAGVTKWVARITDCDLVAVADTFKSYGPNTDYQVQYTGIPITKDVMKQLGCDGNGVKITPPVDR